MELCWVEKKIKGGRVFVLMRLLPEAINISMQGNYNIYYTQFLMLLLTLELINSFPCRSWYIDMYVYRWYPKGEKKNNHTPNHTTLAKAFGKWQHARDRVVGMKEK